MKKGHEEFSKEFHKLRDELIEAICERMKELGCVKLNYWRDFPFLNCNGCYQSVEVEKLEYDDEGDVIAFDSLDNEWSLKEEGTVDGCIELLYYLEEGEYKIVKD